VSWWSSVFARLVPHRLVDVAPGELCTAHRLHELPDRSALAAGRAAVVVDAGVVQAQVLAAPWLNPLSRVMRQRRSWRDAALLVWADEPFTVRITVPTLVSSDGHGLTAVVSLRLRLAPPAESGRVWSPIPSRESEIAARLLSSLAARLFTSARASDGRHIFDSWAADSQVRQLISETAAESLAGVAVVEPDPLVEVESEHFRTVRQRRLELDAERSAAAALRDASLVRGSVRLITHRDRIEQLQTQAELATLEAVFLHDAELTRKSLAGELKQADVDAATEWAGHARRQADAVIEIIDAASRVQSKLFDSAGQLAAHLSAQMDGRFGGAAFSAHERHQVQSLLTEAASTARSPQEVLVALQSGLPLPLSLFEPFRKLAGTHQVNVGTEWRVFDGETLWLILATKVSRPRRWFWHGRCRAAVHFSVTGRPGGRKHAWVLRASGTTADIGGHSLRGRVVSELDSGVVVQFGLGGNEYGNQVAGAGTTTGSRRNA